MPASSRAPGNVSDCYFVGRQELLGWMSAFLQEDVQKVEDCASGHQYCMLLDACYPGQVPMARVRFYATQEWEREENLKIVQAVLTKNGVDRAVDVGRLCKGKYQDNLEFLQWFKWFFDQTYQYQSGSYPAAEIRAKYMKQKGQSAPRPSQPLNRLNPRPARAQAASSPAKAEEYARLLEKYEHKQRETKFYYNKLHEIEIYAADLRDRYMEAHPGAQAQDDPFDILHVLDAIESVLFAEPE